MLTLIVASASPPNFISDIFYLAIAMSHYGYQRTIQSYTGLGKTTEDMQRHLDYLNGDGSWMGVSYDLFSVQRLCSTIW